MKNCYAETSKKNKFLPAVTHTRCYKVTIFLIKYYGLMFYRKEEIYIPGPNVCYFGMTKLM